MNEKADATKQREAAEAAAAWWTQVLREGATQNNGDAAQSAVLSWVQEMQPKITDEQLTAFNAELIASILKLWAVIDSRPSGFFFGCDYHPDAVIKEASIAAGIKADCPPFPVKTSMRVCQDFVSVRYGYVRGVPPVIWGTQPPATDA